MNHSVAVFWLSVLFITASPALAQSLEYSPKVGDDYRYEFDIELRLGPETTTLRGTTNYRIESVNGDEVTMTCVGGLHEKKVATNPGLDRPGPNGRPGLPFPPRIGPSIPLPFEKPVFRGKTITTNKVTITKKGELVAMVGESDLPYLLGHLSMLPFEPLPVDGQKQWSMEGKQGIQTVKQSDRFGAFGGFQDRNDRDLRAATTMQTYELLREDDKAAVVRKDYQLTLPVKSEDAVLELTGSGQWTFDKQRKMSSSMAFKYQMKIEFGGAIVSAPLSVNYRLLSADELAQRDRLAEQEKKETALREEQNRLEAERPLDATERAKIMAGLNGQRAYDQMVALQTLGKKTPTDPDPPIVAKIRQLMDDGADNAVKQTARRVLENWDPEFKKQNKLVASYDSQMSVESTGRIVDENTRLYVGQIVQVKDHSRWKAATITELLGSGRAEVKLRGPFPKLEIHPRSEIQLAPEDLPQPKAPGGFRSPQVSAAAGANASSPTKPSVADKPLIERESRGGGGALTPPRQWSSTSGQFTVVASLMLMTENELVLKREDGKLITVALKEMSAVDQAFIEGLRTQRQQPLNPFE